jgi:hypothetical protein
VLLLQEIAAHSGEMGADAATAEGSAMGGVINILIGLVLVGGGLSGNLVLRGTDSGPLLAVLGAGLVAYGGYQLWRARRT